MTNFNFILRLLEAGADPNAQDHLRKTSLIHNLEDAPGAAKSLLNWPTTDVNITTRSGPSFLAKVRVTVENFLGKAALPDNPNQVQDQFLLRQWQEIKEMLVERGTVDTDITTLE